MSESDLSICSICGGEAAFTDNDPGALPVSYCSADLPAHLRERAAAGQLPLRDDTRKRGLLEDARELDVEGRSSMGKEELAIEVSKARAADLTNPADVVEPGTMSDAPPTFERDDVVKQPRRRNRS